MLEDEKIPVDGVAIAASDKLFQVNMSLLNGEMSPHKKYPLNLGFPLPEVSTLDKQDFTNYAELKVTQRKFLVTKNREV